MAKVYLDSNCLLSDVTPENCGQQLRSLREHSGISREELARMVGVDRATILRIEQPNGATPSIDFINRLKAVQCIGLSNVSDSDANEPDFFCIHAKPGSGKSTVLAELKHSPQRLTPAGIIAGLSAIALAAVAPSSIAAISLPSSTGMSFIGYGMIKALADVARRNGFELRQVKNRWELRPVRSNRSQKRRAMKQTGVQARRNSTSDQSKRRNNK